MNKGFFTYKQTESKEYSNGKIHSCVSCGLHKHCESPKMKPYGNFKKGIVCLGEAPGKIEDERGRPWQGKTGRLLNRTLRKFGIDLFEDCLSLNSVNCRPPENRTPTKDEINTCRRYVLKTINNEYSPKLILLLGNSAIYSLIGYRWKKDLGGITKWRGWTIPDQDFGSWICPVFHPSYIERSDSKEVVTVWENDIEQALNKLNEPFPKHIKPEIEIITDLSALNKIQDSSDMLIAFDYETTGLKPQEKGHRIVCASIADKENHCYVFLMPNTRKELKPFLDLLGNASIQKMAHNIKFEDTWSNIRLKQKVENWFFDSMLAAHVLDNRYGITGLKFQTYVNFGIIDYSSEIEPYLRGKGKSANDFNSVDKLLMTSEGITKLLYYCSLDSIYEYRLAMKQLEIMDHSFLPF